jgi:hypothetical protein
LEWFGKFGQIAKMYPTGSNRASQAIIDARIIGARLLDHGLEA